jgi:glycerol-3-phosphate dehydrogenase (NAD(P)+)
MTSYPEPAKVAVIGTTSWGTTLAVLLAGNGLSVHLWARTEQEAHLLSVDRENKQRLPGKPFPLSLTVTHDLAEALYGSRLVILAVPSQHMRANVRQAAPHIERGTLVMSAAKGLEVGSLLRMSQVMREELPPELHSACCVLSGPNISREIAEGLPAATVVAANGHEVAEAAQSLVMTPRFRVYSSTDMIGVELGGTLKNIVALGAGMNDGWGYGANAKAAFMTRGLAEITRLGVAAGANPFTFLGLAGFGDLVATCTSPYSRNRRVGEALATGRPLSEVLVTLGGTAEGITTTLAARELAHRLNVEMPITELTYQGLYEGLDPRKAILELMNRNPKNELEGLGA